MTRYTQRYAKTIKPKTSYSHKAQGRKKRQTRRRFMICDLPPFNQPPGTLYVILELGHEIVGFARLDFNYCELVHNSYGFTEDHVGMIVEDTSIMIIDEYQRRGLGTVFAELNEFIDIEYGAEWISGTTFVKQGMLNIRLHSGWSVVNMLPEYGQAIIRKRLK